MAKATERTITLLLGPDAFAKLDAAEQRARLAEYVVDWYRPEHDLPTVDNIRFTQRLRTYARKAGRSPGAAMETILASARQLYEAAVPEADNTGARAIQAQSPEPEPATTS